MDILKGFEVRRCRDLDEFYRRSAGAVSDKVKAALSTNGECSLAVSGGKTPQRLFELLAEESIIDWSSVNLFWVDERCVPHDSQESNFKMVHEALLSKVSISAQNIHRIETEGYSPEEASANYEARLKEFFGTLPSFDLVLLGMGDDGHVASLFPGDAALRETKRWAVSVDGKQGFPSVPRVTLTLPVINNSKYVLFLVRGENKKRVLDEIIGDSEGAVKKYPAAMVDPEGEMTWITL